MIHPEDVAAFVDAARLAAVAGGEEVLSLILEHPGRVRLWRKGGRDVVTEADLRSRDAIRRVIRDWCPVDPVLDEESAAERRLPPGRVWVVDPLDGTVNFASGLPLWSVSVAVAVDGEVVAGAVRSASGAVYQAGLRLAALRDGRPVCPSRVRLLDDAVVSVTVAPGFSAEQEARACEYVGRLASRVRGVRVFCSGALELCWLAEGRLDGCICPSGAFFSAAAGALIAGRAGCQVLDLEGRPYRAGESTGLLAAATPELARALLDILAGAGGTRPASVSSDNSVSEVSEGEAGRGSS
ncbi:MAG: inositol monophosphatase [Bacillota bacterium]